MPSANPPPPTPPAAPGPPTSGRPDPPSRTEPPAHPSLLAAASALAAIDEAVRTAHTAEPAEPPPEETGPAGDARAATSEQALAALLLLREVRSRLAGWEPELIEAARAAGASWADLAGPLGVTSRQAAERRYLRLRPGDAGATGEQRVKATRDRRAADRTVSAWSRANATGLRQLAGQITALPDLPAGAHSPVSLLARALADDNPATLVAPLADTRPHIEHSHPELAARIADITHRTTELRRESDDLRGGGAP